MAISANAVWECRSTATAGNANGGFFVTGATGTDYSQQNAAQYNLTGCSAGGGSATLAHASAAADMVGNGLKVVSGTNATVGWYEIISVNVGVDITVDRNCTTGATVNTVVNIGGAASLGGSGASTDDAMLETCTAGNKIWIKAGTYTLTGSIALGTGIGTVSARIVYEGYNTTRGDAPTGTNRPLIIFGAFAWSCGVYTDIKHLSFDGTSGTSGITLSTNGHGYNIRMYGHATTTGVNATTGGYYWEGCEFISLRGRAFGGNASTFYGCYFHDSDKGCFITGNAGNILVNCILARNVTSAYEPSTGIGRNHLINCTIYGSSARVGTGMLILTGIVWNSLYNCIVTGFTTGVSHADAGNITTSIGYTNFYNNGTDVTNAVKDASCIALDPQFADVTEITGTTATISGSVLTDNNVDFNAAGVVDGVDILHLISGTGALSYYKYGIVSHTQHSITLSSAPGDSATADHVYSISHGHDFRVGVNMANAAYPGLFGDGTTHGYLDIGAVQRKPATIATGILD